MRVIRPAALTPHRRRRPLLLALSMLAAGMLKTGWSFSTTGSMQESDIVVLVAGFMTCMLGLLAEVIVAHHRR